MKGRLSGLLFSWSNLPIVLSTNPKTGLKLGDDKFYRSVRTLSVNPSPLMQPNIVIRAPYDGTSPYDGTPDDSQAIKGGLKGKRFVLRQTFAKGVEWSDGYVQKFSGGYLRFCGLDAYRHPERQRQGFLGLFLPELKRRNIAPNVAGDLVHLKDVIQAGLAADDIFSYLGADTKHEGYAPLAARLKMDTPFWNPLVTIATELDKDVDELLHVYISICRNAEIGDRVPYDLPVDFKNNTHCGAGAWDVFLIRPDGKPLSLVPYDWMGPEAALDFLEGDGNYRKYKAAVEQSMPLQMHLSNCGFEPLRFSFEDWCNVRSAIRILFHLSNAVGWTMYCNEPWHINGSNMFRHPETGVTLFSEPLTAAQYPDSGNASLAFEKHGLENAVAVWDGNTALPLADEIGIDS